MCENVKIHLVKIHVKNVKIHLMVIAKRILD